MWYGLPSGEIEKIQIAPERSHELRHFVGHALVPSLIYPAAAGKDIHVDPYATLVERFRAALAAARFSVCIGYSFRDRHIKSVVLQRMRTNLRLHIVVVDPNVADTLAESDRVLPNPTFSSVRSRVVPAPMPAALELAFGGLRDRIGLVRRITDTTTAADDWRRRGDSVTASQLRSTALADLTHAGWGALAARAVGTDGLDYVPEGLQYVRQTGTTPQYLFGTTLLACSQDPSLRATARRALGVQLKELLRGVPYISEGRRLVIETPDDRTIEARLLGPERVAGLDLGTFRIALLDRTRAVAYHLSLEQKALITAVQVAIEAAQRFRQIGTGFQPEEEQALGLRWARDGILSLVS
jgi:hypothetical protein